jgi:hypothetical protein
MAVSGERGGGEWTGGDGGGVGGELRAVEDCSVVCFGEFLVVGVDFVVVHLTCFAVYCGACCATQVCKVELDHGLWGCFQGKG